MMRIWLILLFSTILVSMLAITTYASMDRSILKVGPELWADPWFQATLVDAYFGFITFFVWVAYKEQRWWKRLAWFVAIMGLGNIAMAVYALRQIAGYDPKSGLESVLLRRANTEIAPSPSQ